jgi:hypothetical protein
MPAVGCWALRQDPTSESRVPVAVVDMQVQCGRPRVAGCRCGCRVTCWGQEVLTSDVLVSALSWCICAGRTLILVFGLASLIQVVFAQDSRLNFNIPAQPLPTALERYGDITGRNSLYNGTLGIGRRSTAVEGRLTADAALTRLLEGTGLAATRVTSTAFTLLSVPVGILQQSAVADYYGRIQVSLRNALCGAGSARPGNYRIGMRLWIDNAGSVTRYERLNSSGASYVDAGIDQALRHLHIGTQPPAELAQPVSVVIIPQGPGVTMSCADPVASRNGALP